jgi:CHAT domain-containing protein
MMHGSTPLTVAHLQQADGLGRPRLVVLSACETGLYEMHRDYDQFIGLPGAFLTIGAAGVVGTLWPVSDAATALLMAKFYELHLGASMAPPTALHRAQAWLREATTDDFAAFARGAAAQGRLQSRHLAELESELSEEGLKRSRNHALVEWLERDGKASPAGVQRLARPYAHPYFWAGFIYTGL